jgi:hypothetical protein
LVRVLVFVEVFVEVGVLVDDEVIVGVAVGNPTSSKAKYLPYVFKAQSALCSADTKGAYSQPTNTIVIGGWFE